jgi:hypothetical protein
VAQEQLEDPVLPRREIEELVSTLDAVANGIKREIGGSKNWSRRPASRLPRARIRALSSAKAKGLVK